jgi:hypothetical protein
MPRLQCVDVDRGADLSNEPCHGCADVEEKAATGVSFVYSSGLQAAICALMVLPLLAVVLVWKKTFAWSRIVRTLADELSGDFAA